MSCLYIVSNYLHYYILYIHKFIQIYIIHLKCYGSGSVWNRFILTSRIRIRFMNRIQKQIRVAKNQPKSWKISTKINKNHKNITHFFLKKILNFYLTEKNIYLKNYKTDNLLEKLIFYWKKKLIFFLSFFSFSILSRIRSRIRIRFSYFTKRIRGSRSISK